MSAGTSRKKVTAVLAPEGETLWVCRPDILLFCDVVLLGQEDYARIRRRSTASAYNQRLFGLLEAYINDGYVELYDAHHLLPSTDRGRIQTGSQDLIESMCSSEKCEAGLQAHRGFISYLDAKLEHLRPGEAPFDTAARSRHATVRNLGRLARVGIENEDYPADIEELQRRSIAKWMAAEVLGKRSGGDLVFDSSSCSPYAKRVRQWVSQEWGADDNPMGFDPAQLVEPADVMFSEVSKLFPGLRIDGVDDIFRLRPARDEFSAFRAVFRDIVRFHESVGQVPVLQRYVERRFLEAQDLISSVLESGALRRLAGATTAIDVLLEKVLLPLKPKGLIEGIERRRATRLFARARDAYEKLCCFSHYARRSPLPMAKLAEVPFDPESRGHWVTGRKPAWYECGAPASGEEEASC